ncbi:hypothetical protein C8R43DRAFT_955373 [Mycena crocata]|nr:hypothetical protein C8R43DRAFT_955373 [Mycena crocata]
MLSTLSLVSLSSKSLVGLFGSMFIGAQVTFTVMLSGLSVPKTSLRATPTREIALLPTKCVLSSGSNIFPRVCITVGFATVVLASLFCIFRAKGFISSTSSQKKNDVASQPPSPPPEPGSSSSAVKAPWPIRWLLFLMIALLVLLIVAAGIVACAYFTHSVPPPLRELASFCSQRLWICSPLQKEHFVTAETNFWDAWDVVLSYPAAAVSYLSEHGLRHSKLLLLALTTHLICLLISSNLLRFRKHVVQFVQEECLIIGMFLMMIVGISSFSQLSWIFWGGYYFYHGRILPSIDRIIWNFLCFSSYLSSLATTHFDVLSMIIGISVIYASTVCLWLGCHVLCGLPSSTMGITRRLLHPAVLHFLVTSCLFGIAVISVECLVLWSLLQYSRLGPVHQDLLWKSVFCPKGRPFTCQNSRQRAKALLWDLLGNYQEWKAVQIEDFKELAAAVPNTLIARLSSGFEIWHGLHPMQKLLIAAPALIFYGFLIVSLSRVIFFSFSSRFFANSSPPYAGSRDVSGTGFELFRTYDTDESVCGHERRRQSDHSRKGGVDSKHYHKRGSLWRDTREATGAAMRIIDTGGDAFQYTFLATSKLSHLRYMSPKLVPCLPVSLSSTRQKFRLRLPTAENQVIPAVVHVVHFAPKSLFF